MGRKKRVRDQEIFRTAYIRRSWLAGFVEGDGKSARPRKLLAEERLSFLRMHIYGGNGLVVQAGLEKESSPFHGNWIDRSSHLVRTNNRVIATDQRGAPGRME